MTTNERHSNSTKSCVNNQNGEEIFNIIKEVVVGVNKKRIKKRIYGKKYQQELPAHQIRGGV